MFRINARGRQVPRPATAAANGPLSFALGAAARVAQPAAPAPVAAPLRVTADALRKLLRAGNVPVAVVVAGPLRLPNESWLRELPASLECT